MVFKSLKEGTRKYLNELKQEYNENKQFRRQVRDVEKQEMRRLALENAKKKQQLLAKERLRNYERQLKERSQRRSSPVEVNFFGGASTQKKKGKRFDVLSGRYI